LIEAEAIQCEIPPEGPQSTIKQSTRLELYVQSPLG
jgi:hypothetical protein